MPASSQPVPLGHTARRLSWPHLPPALRERIEDRLGSPVVEAAPQDGGFTPGFASVLTGADGRQHFVKAASATAQRPFAASYRAEASVLAALPAEVPAPRLLWSLDEDWMVLGIEHCAGRLPAHPWQTSDLESALAALTTCAQVLTPLPPDLEVASFGEEFQDLPGHWDHVRRSRPEQPHLAEAAALAATFDEVTDGDALVHTDLRDDNVMIVADGSARVCNWTWPARGAAWIDTVQFLIGPRGDGLDVDAVLCEHPLTREVPADHIDRVLALQAGFFAKAADDPVPPNSPYLRQYQAHCRDVVWDWLSQRRGWS